MQPPKNPAHEPTVPTLTEASAEALSEALAEALRARGWRLTVAESCTGGWLAKVLTDLAGSSVWFECGFVTYSNDAKQRLLGVRADTLERYGAVSEAVVAEMASGALARAQVDVAVAISGIAGPGGGSPQKPVGTVCLAWALGPDAVESERCWFPGDRAAVRRAAVQVAIDGLLKRLGASEGGHPMRWQRLR